MAYCLTVSTNMYERAGEDVHGLKRSFLAGAACHRQGVLSQFRNYASIARQPRHIRHVRRTPLLAVYPLQSRQETALCSTHCSKRPCADHRSTGAQIARWGTRHWWKYATAVRLDLLVSLLSSVVYPHSIHQNQKSPFGCLIARGLWRL